MYTIYHIPGKKIGVTRNIKKRVTEQQGYAPDEYEVLLTSEDIDYISTMEIELQKSYGYKVDRQTYKNLINKRNKMNINVTEQTTTFPCPLNKLKGNLMENIGLKWTTEHGTFGLDDQTVDWIIKNAKVSMFNINRCYIYNKAYAAEFLELPETIKTVEKETPNVFDDIRSWAKERGIYERGDSQTQYVKLMEEAGELAQALLKRDESEIYDAIGDMIVVLTNLAELEGVKVEDCISAAYNEIANRKGKMINGTFVKNNYTTTLNSYIIMKQEIEFRDPVVKRVVNKFISRSDVGFEKYGVTLQDDPSEVFEWLNHLQEELMDAVLYLQKAKETYTDKIQDEMIASMDPYEISKWITMSENEKTI